MKSRSADHRHPRKLRWLLLADALVMVLFVSLAGMSLQASREAYRHRALTAAENLAESLQQNIAAQLTRVDTAMRGVVMELQRLGRGYGGDRVATEALLNAQMVLVPELQSLRIADDDGVVRFGPGVPATEQVDVRGRDFFRRARDGDGAGVLLSEPLLSRISKKWVIVLARRLVNPDGSFGGVIYGVLETAHFERLLSRMDLGTQGAASLRSSDMQLIARYTAGRSVLEGLGSTMVSPQLAEAVAADPARGAYIARTALDRIERTNAYRKVGAYPLLVLVGLGTEEYFAPWHTQLRQVAVLILLAGAVVAVASLALHRAWRREAVVAAALAREARRHQTLLHTASDGVHVVDRSGRLVEFSESFAAGLGYSRAQMAGWHISRWDALLPLEEIAGLVKNFQIGQAHKFETRHRQADGHLIDVEITSVAVLVEGQELIYCASRDITDRKKLAAQLAASTAEVQDLYDNAPCGYHSLDQDGRFLYANMTAASWLGCPREALIGHKRMTDFFTAEGGAQFQRQFPRLKAEGRVEGLEFELVVPGRAARRVSLSATAVTDAEGKFQMTRTVMHDITELHAARERLRQLTREQQVMLDNELIGIVKLRNRRVVWMNLAMERVFGYAAQDLMGRSLQHLHLDEDSYNELGRQAYGELQSGAHFRAQLKMRHKDGHILWVDANGVMLDQDSQESMWLLADITPIKKSQEQAEYIAFHDLLTGLPNRLLLASRMEQAMPMAARYGRHLALCYLDLDGFKQVNDVHGHAAGDQLLQQVATRLQSAVRANDTVCRVGGDEFVILLTHLEDSDEYMLVLERVALEVGQPVCLENGHEVSVSASIGVAFYPQDGQELQTLLGNADRAMYQAKKSGNSRICLFQAMQRGQ